MIISCKKLNFVVNLKTYVIKLFTVTAHPNKLASDVLDDKELAGRELERFKLTAIQNRVSDLMLDYRAYWNTIHMACIMFPFSNINFL